MSKGLRVKFKACEQLPSIFRLAEDLHHLDAVVANNELHQILEIFLSNLVRSGRLAYSISRSPKGTIDRVIGSSNYLVYI